KDSWRVTPRSILHWIKQDGKSDSGEDDYPA
ncbi:unnamed protein product, partial [marine sediment metagenome]